MRDARFGPIADSCRSGCQAEPDCASGPQGLARQSNLAQDRSSAGLPRSRFHSVRIQPVLNPGGTVAMHFVREHDEIPVEPLVIVSGPFADPVDEIGSAFTNKPVRKPAEPVQESRDDGTGEPSLTELPEPPGELRTADSAAFDLKRLDQGTKWRSRQSGYQPTTQHVESRVDKVRGAKGERMCLMWG